jgi:multiple sugar transport system permease protein
MKRGAGWTLLGAACALALAALWAAPLLWALSTALRPELETVSTAFHWLPQQTWTLDAFRQTLSSGNLGRWLFNSFLVALLVTVATMAISLMAAYAFSQLRFRGRAIVFGIAMLAFLLPFEALLVPLFRTMNQLGLINSYAGIVLPQVVSPVAIYVFKQFFDGIPADFREAATMDGAGPLRVLWSVYLPISGNIVWAMAIVTFIAAWNNFLWPFIVITSNDMMTIPLGLTQTYDAFGVRYAQLMAAALLGALPVALAYVAFQRRVTQGFLAASGSNRRTKESMASVSLRGIRKRYGDNEVIKGVDLEIEDGQFVVFVGPSGCGKSTLLRMIAGLEDISAGTLEWRDAEQRGRAGPARHRDGVPELCAVPAHDGGREHGLRAEAGQGAEGRDRERVGRAAEILQIEHLLERKPKALSGGQRQRVAIGRAIVASPRCSCSTSRCRTWTPPCAPRPGSNWRACTAS